MQQTTGVWLSLHIYKVRYSLQQSYEYQSNYKARPAYANKGVENKQAQQHYYTPRNPEMQNKNAALISERTQKHSATIYVYFYAENLVKVILFSGSSAYYSVCGPVKRDRVKETLLTASQILNESNSLTITFRRAVPS